MSSTNTEDNRSPPKRALQQAYLECFQARLDWVELNANGANEDILERAHAQLHAKTFSWYEALQPYLEEFDALDYFWNEVDLLQRPKTFYAWRCDTCGDGALLESNKYGENGDICLDCGKGQVTLHEFYEKDDDGEQVYETILKGLQSVDGWQQEYDVVEERQGKANPKTVRHRVPRRLKPELLQRIARELDKAADRIDLIADVKKDVPKTEITKDTIEGFRERVQEVVVGALTGDEQIGALEIDQLGLDIDPDLDVDLDLDDEGVSADD